MKYISNFIPAAVANALNAHGWALVFQAATEGVQYAQAKYPHLVPAARKAEAVKFGLNNWPLFEAFGENKQTWQYIETIGMSAAVDGVVATFNLGGWFTTSSQVEYGGANNPAPAGAVTQLPGPVPTVLPEHKQKS